MQRATEKRKPKTRIWILVFLIISVVRNVVFISLFVWQFNLPPACTKKEDTAGRILQRSRRVYKKRSIMLLFLVCLGLLAGAGVGARIIVRALSESCDLANPTFRPDVSLFAWHLCLCLWVTLVSGPTSLVLRSSSMYWSGVVAVWLLSLPVVYRHNRNTETFGIYIGTWVRFRNVFEVLLFIATAIWAPADDWVTLAQVHYFVWYYRLLDVGPRRLLRSWPRVNFLFVVVLYMLWGITVFKSADLTWLQSTQVSKHAMVSYLHGPILASLTLLHGLALLPLGETRTV